MGTTHSLAVGVIGILGLVGSLGWTASAQARAPTPATLACDDDPSPDTNQPRNSNLPPVPNPMAAPIDGSLLNKRLPCAEIVSNTGLFGNDNLANLQRGLDFYSMADVPRSECPRRWEVPSTGPSRTPPQMGAPRQFQTAARCDA